VRIPERCVENIRREQQEVSFVTDDFAVGKRGEFEFTEKKSVFIGYAAPVKSEAEALAFVAEIKAKHFRVSADS